MNQIDNIRTIYKDAVGNITDKFDDFVQMSKIHDIIKKEEKKAKNKKLIILLSIIGGVILVAGVAIAVYEFISRRRVVEYDLYDDLDNYYEDEKEVMSDPVGNLGLSEQDFAE